MGVQVGCSRVSQPGEAQNDFIADLSQLYVPRCWPQLQE